MKAPIVVALAIMPTAAPSEPVCSSSPPEWAVALTADPEGRLLRCTGAVVRATSRPTGGCDIVIATAKHCLKNATTAWIKSHTAGISTRGLHYYADDKSMDADFAYLGLEIPTGLCPAPVLEVVQRPSDLGQATIRYFHEQRNKFCTQPNVPVPSLAVDDSGATLTDGLRLLGVLSGENAGIRFAGSVATPPLDRIGLCSARGCEPIPGFSRGDTRLID